MDMVVMTLIIHNEADRMLYWGDRLSHALNVELERRFAAHGVTPAQFRLLAALARRDADTVRGLAAALRLDGAAVTRLADRLQAKGLVRREPDLTDGRSVRLSLSEEGVELVPLLDTEASAHERDWFGPLSYSELRQYKLTLAKLLQRTGSGPDEVWLRRDLQ
jgi:DNA-binding MarR family transcriptional regulator